MREERTVRRKEKFPDLGVVREIIAGTEMLETSIERTGNFTVYGLWFSEFFFSDGYLFIYLFVHALQRVRQTSIV